jgi:predicted transcriptional regulator
MYAPTPKRGSRGIHGRCSLAAREPFSSIDGYTFGMKTAVSIPDDLFRRADEYASRSGKSRSELYREALADTCVRGYDVRPRQRSRLDSWDSSSASEFSAAVMACGSRRADEEVVARIEGHIRSDHPELAETFTRDEIATWVEVVE